jgi:hypothetical protein
MEAHRIGTLPEAELRATLATARWKLGRALDRVERGHGPGRGKKVEPAVQSFTGLLKRLGLASNTATDAHRIGTLPERGSV